jgi:hypothetical protein
MFKAGKMYRHRNSLDLDMLVLAVEEVSGTYHLTVRHWNRFYLLTQGDVDYVEVSEKDVENWQALS